MAFALSIEKAGREKEREQGEGDNEVDSTRRARTAPSPEVASPFRCPPFSFSQPRPPLAFFSPFFSLSSSFPLPYSHLPTPGARLPLPQLRRPDPRAAKTNCRVHLRQPRHRLHQAHGPVLRAGLNLYSVQVRRRRGSCFRQDAGHRDLQGDAVRVPGQVRGAAERGVQGQVKKVNVKKT